MKRNLHSFSITIDVMIAIVAHELGELKDIAKHVPASERALYEIVERSAFERLPPEVQRLIKERRVYDRAHKLLLEDGFEAWQLCLERKHPKNACCS